MARGGKRKNSGRKPILSSEERFFVFHRYRTLILEFTNQKTHSRHKKRFQNDDLEEGFAHIRSVAPGNALLLKKLADELDEMPDEENEEGEFHPATPPDSRTSKYAEPIIEAAVYIRDSRRLRRRKGPVTWAVSLHGEKPEIINKVIKELFDKYSKKIGRSMVENIIANRNGEFDDFS